MDIWGLADEIQLLEIMYSLIESPRKVLALANDYIGKGEKSTHFRATLFHCSCTSLGFACLLLTGLFSFLILVIITKILIFLMFSFHLLLLGLCTYMGFG